MPRARIPIVRGDWDAYQATGCLPAGITRATLYRRAQQEGWSVPDPIPHTVTVANQVTPSEQAKVLGDLKIRLEFYATNREESDQQVLRLISKLRCNLESWIEGVIKAGKLIPPKAMVHITRVLVNLEKMEYQRQEWIAKIHAKARRVVIVERVIRERPPEPDEMEEAGPSTGGSSNIPGPTSMPSAGAS